MQSLASSGRSEDYYKDHCFSPVLFNVFLQAIVDEVSRRLELAGISGGVTRVHHDGNELKWPQQAGAQVMASVC